MLHKTACCFNKSRGPYCSFGFAFSSELCANDGKSPRRNYRHFILLFHFVLGDTTSQPLLPAVIALSVLLSFAIAGIGFLVWRQWRYLHARKGVTGTKQQQDNILLKDNKASSRSRQTEETSHFQLRSVRAAQGPRAAEHHYQELLRSNNSPVYENVIG